MSAHASITRAAEIIEQHAQELLLGHTDTNGEWGDDDEARADYAEAIDVAARLRALAPPPPPISAQPADVALLQRALAALEYHRSQTRPIAQTDAVIEALRAATAASGRPDAGT